MESKEAKIKGWWTGAEREFKKERAGRERVRTKRGRKEELINRRMVEANNLYLMASSFSSTDSQGWRSSLNSRSSKKKERIQTLRVSKHKAFKRRKQYYLASFVNKGSTTR